MPRAILDFGGYVFFFWSNETGEPIHIHVSRGRQTPDATKFWIKPDGVELAHNKGKIAEHELNKLRRYISANRAEIVDAWYRHFGVN